VLAEMGLQGSLAQLKGSGAGRNRVAIHCPGAGPWPSGPRADPGLALKDQGKGHT